MTKKHYEAIANIVRNCIEADTHMLHGANVKALETQAHMLADYFASDNPRFNRIRFLTACGVDTCEHDELYVRGMTCTKCGA